MTTMNVKDAAGSTVPIEKPLPPGSTTDSASRPVAFSTEGKAQLGATNETAASALNSTVGLNGLIRGFWTAFGLKTDAKSTATDTTSVSAMSIWKQISASVQAIAASVAGTLTVATHAVTQSGSWVLSAGSALIGKVGIDQTTDGTTNRVAPPITRPVILTGTFTPGTSYSIGNSIGGKITVATGLTAGSIVHVQEIQLRIGAATFTAGSAVAVSYHLYESDPSSSTITDASAFIENSADAVKLAATASVGALPGQVAANEAATWATGPARALTVDGSGNVYIVFVAGGTFTMTTPYAAWRLELRR